MAQTAYVFVYLPEHSQPVVAGRFDWEPAGPAPVGEFVYAQSYLANNAAVPLDPVALPLRAQVFATTLSSGFFGVVRDAIPDDWGRHVARIPNVIYVRWFDEEHARGNTSLRMFTPEFDQVVQRKLRNPEWAYLRTDRPALQAGWSAELR